MKWLKSRLSSAKEQVGEKWKAAFIVIGALLVPFIVWKVPEWQVRAYHGRLDASAISKLTPQELIQLQKDLITAENNARVTLAQIVGGLVVLLGLYATFKNVRVAEEGKLTERFSKAVELLGNDKLDVRLGGIYALERIARDSLKDHWAVMEILTAFVREQSRKTHGGKLERLSDSGEEMDAHIRNKKPPADIQAALTVIGRRKWTDQEKTHQRIDLRDSFLIRAYLSGANLRRALLSNTDLTKANLISADLTEASLWGAKLNDAFLRKTRLIKANLSDADLSNATLEYTKLQEADLRETKLPTLINVDLSASIGLTWEQISEAAIDETTKLPPELEKRRRTEQEKK
ncbi:MAG TPA: pentapeptide repeat-containing protein [Blastocatellia bacterium]|jgi:hypothetical protein|nr:pentapeptide repeat-containing protein [Blastocatellia bacterium]